MNRSIRTTRNWVQDHTNAEAIKEAKRIIKGESDHFQFVEDPYDDTNLMLLTHQYDLPKGTEARSVEIALMALLLPHNKRHDADGILIRNKEEFLKHQSILRRIIHLPFPGDAESKLQKCEKLLKSAYQDYDRHFLPLDQLKLPVPGCHHTYLDAIGINEGEILENPDILKKLAAGVMQDYIINDVASLAIALENYPPNKQLVEWQKKYPLIYRAFSEQGEEIKEKIELLEADRELSKGENYFDSSEKIEKAIADGTFRESEAIAITVKSDLLQLVRKSLSRDRS